MKSNKFRGLMTLSLVLAWTYCARAQPASQPKAISTLTELTTLAADPAVRIDFPSVRRMLNILGADDRSTALKQLISSRNEELSVDLSLMAISERKSDFAGPIASRVDGWKSTNQAVVLQRLAMTRERFIEVPREVIRKALREAKEDIAEPAPGAVAVEPVGLAAILLAGTREKADAQMILEIARLRPRSWGIWMAVGYTSVLDSRSARLATDIWKDISVPLPVRVAAASALSTIDTQAATFAKNHIEAFLDKYGDRDLGSLLQAAMGSTPGGETKRQYEQFRGNFHLIVALLILKDELAQPLAVHFLAAVNQDIRNLCGIVVARRWPDRLLMFGSGAFTEREYAALVALLLEHHPERIAAQSGLTPERMEKAKAEIRESGLGVFGLSGNLLNVF